MEGTHSNWIFKDLQSYTQTPVLTGTSSGNTSDEDKMLEKKKTEMAMMLSKQKNQDHDP